MGFALIEQPPQRGKRGRGRGRGRRARDPVKTPGRTREERCLPELLSRLSLGKHAQKLKHLDYAGMKTVDQEDLETLGLDAEDGAVRAGISVYTTDQDVERLLVAVADVVDRPISV